MADQIQYYAYPHAHPMLEIDGLSAWATTIEGMIPLKISQLQDDLNLMKKTDTIDYNAITNKPTIPTVSYPVTSVNTKKGDVVITSSDTGSAPAVHTHDIASVTGLQAALDSKASNSSIRKQEVFSGVTDSSGNYTVVFSIPYTVTPNIQYRIIGGTYNQTLKVVASKTGFTVSAGVRVGLTVAGLSVLGADVTAATGVSVDVLVTAK
ncbi:hypothetical protein PHB09_030 [Pseudomonas phage PHB09]|uniref:Tail fiber protein n=1 Tax=Pseudomonas phage PHB09 TaxID=2867265 RepID=A0AAE9BND6_9CAUD|nr:hypothetical protein QGX10_gp030 [Pseudomonas phage PHB09]UAV84526.1 hypothetical protein PHB09_030 [Pseudomonas phage PHB09]